MGLLSSGEPLTWSQITEYCSYIQDRGVAHFIKCWAENKDKKMDDLVWGDEIEYTLLHFSPTERRVRASLRANELLDRLSREKPDGSDWRPEYGGYMVEGIPKRTYAGNFDEYVEIERNMTNRRLLLREMLQNDENGFYDCLCITSVPRLGCRDFTKPTSSPSPDGVCGSLFFTDEAIFDGHPRFKYLTRNIRDRRGKKVEIYIPVYKDTCTPSPFKDDFDSTPPPDDHINMDAMGFGMGLSCLQVTFQTSDLRESRELYDQLVPLCPVVMALSSSCPSFKGLLADYDGRWPAIEAAVDDRTSHELNDGKPAKSRYGTVDCYLSEKGGAFNDIDIQWHPHHYEALTNAGIDHLLAQHVAHLFIRDPLTIYKEMLPYDNDHFDNIQSTNWQSLRFKPPSPGVNSWRVEFRPLDLQLTDFENSAFVIFIILITRAALSLESLNLCMPISMVDENMKRAVQRGAVLNQKFYFRTNCFDPNDTNVAEMTINEIMNGTERFQGLIPFVRQYIRTHPNIAASTSCSFNKYLDLLSGRASGRLMTGAQLIRNFITSHPDYKRDSRITELIEYDLLMHIRDIVDGNLRPENFFP